MEFIVVASNERQKELESTLSTVKNLDESIQSLTVQIKQRQQEIELLLKEEDPRHLGRRFKVRPRFCLLKRILCLSEFFEKFSAIDICVKDLIRPL